MLKLHHILAVLLLSFSSSVVSGSESTSGSTPHDYLIHEWQTEDGLPQNWVSSITQTPDGYLWIGTRYGGLARFDGVRFVVFNQQNTPDELKDVQVEFLSVDETGTLWVIMGNESITAVRNGKFKLWRWPRVRPRLRVERVLNVRSNIVLFAPEYVAPSRLDLSAGTNGWEVLEPPNEIMPQPRTFHLGRENVTWFITQRQQLGQWVNGRFENFDLHGKVPEPKATAIAVDASRRLWIATPHHLEFWNGSAFEDRTPTDDPPENICQLAFSGDGGLWVLERNRLRKFLNGKWVTDATPWNFQTEPFESSLRLNGDAQGGVWLSRYGQGLWHVKSNGSVRQLTEQDGLPSSFITCWFQDREGDIWIGTAGGGVARIRESVFHALNEDEGLPGKVVRSVCVDDRGELWAGTMAGGLAHWEGQKFSVAPLPARNDAPVESVTVVPDGSNGLWVGSVNQGLMRFESGQFRSVPMPDYFGNAIRVLFTDSRNQLWVGGLVNLFRYENGRFRRFGSEDGFVNNHAIGALAEDASGALWIGTGPGELWKYQNEKFSLFQPPSDWPQVRFAALLPDTNGAVWIGTLGGGLLHFQNGKFTRVMTPQGLPDNNVTQLLDSGDGQIWAGTYAGIFRASKTDLEAAAMGRATRVPCRVYGRFEGLPALECSSGFQPACWRSKDGRLWFSTANGVVWVNPRDVKPNRPAPLVIIEELFVDGKPRDLAAHDQNEGELKIQPGRHYLQFRFTGLNFAAPDGVRFRVKLEGGENQWQIMDRQRSVNYVSLPPGHYRFRVVAANNEGVWNEEGDTLAFVVLPHVWERWWFKLTLGAATLTALGLAVAFTQRRKYRERLERLERQRELERERTRIARDLHDDLGTSLTQVSMLCALAHRDQPGPEEAQELIGQVRGRAREMVTALDEIVWAVNPKNDSLVELINYLGHFAEEFFRPTGIRCRLDIPAQLPSVMLSADVRHHLFLAFKEAVNNAARHAQGTEVCVRVEILSDKLVIQIEDNGRGLDQPGGTSFQTGNGLTNMKRRLEQIGGHAELRSAPGKGTTVTFQAPLQMS